MPDPRMLKLADVLVNYSVAVRPGDKVVIRAGAIAEPMIRALYAKVIEAGGLPTVLATIPGLDELMYTLGSDAQIQHIPEPMKLIMETYDVSITLMSSVNLKALSGIDPQKVVLASQAQQELFATVMQRSATGAFRWVGALFPTHAYAQEAEMSLTDYEDFVYGACLPDLDDPIGYWKAVEKTQQRLVDWLAGKSTVRVEGPDVDLCLRIDGRSFVNCCGTRNMPDGEIFTGPVEDSVEGHVRFSYPTVYQGRRLEGVHLWFERGKVVKAEADKGEDFLLKTIDTDDGARYVGEFAIGTNHGITRATGNTLFDEKIGGSFHMALGAGMPETGSVNRSSIHWDMICDLSAGGRIIVDDTLFYENGEFVVS